MSHTIYYVTYYLLYHMLFSVPHTISCVIHCFLCHTLFTVSHTIYCFTVSVESTGALPAATLVSEALKVLMKKCTDLREKLEHDEDS